MASAAAAKIPRFGNSSRIRKLPLPHNIRDKFRKPGRVFQNFVQSLVRGLIAQIKSSQRSHSSKEDLKAPHNLDGLDLDALVEVSFHKTCFVQILLICFLQETVSFEYIHVFQRYCS